VALVFDDRHLLPPGVHDASLDEVEDFFARFQRSDRRIRLFAKLRQLPNEMARAFPGSQIIVDGSFIMACVDEPGDIDLLLLVPSEIELDREFKPHEYNLISSRRIRAEYGFDSRTAKLGSERAEEWIKFFGQVTPRWCLLFGWPLSSTKGVLRVQL